MSRYRLIQGLLIAGAIVGFTSSFVSLRHHRHGHDHCRGERQPPATSAPR